jgi:hypothetical protein
MTPSVREAFEKFAAPQIIDDRDEQTPEPEKVKTPEHGEST